jgi:hypothetical protein
MGQMLQLHRLLLGQKQASVTLMVVLTQHWEQQQQVAACLGGHSHILTLWQMVQQLSVLRDGCFHLLSLCWTQQQRPQL